MAEKPKRKKRPQPETPVERLKAVALWQWGGLCIVAGLLANQVGGMLSTARANSAAARGETLGRGVAALIFVIVGVVLIIMHFARRKRD